MADGAGQAVEEARLRQELGLPARQPRHGGAAVRLAVLEAARATTDTGKMKGMAELDAIASCNRCEWFEWMDGKSECRRHAPRAITKGGELLNVWPKVQAGDWCGEFSQTWAGC